MKTLRIALLTLLILLGASAVASFAAQTAVGVSINPSTGRSTINLGFFYDDLAPYGNWVRTPRYGWAWTPLGVADTWQPYEDGHWVWTDQGWTWISDEPFGWATYHYGRWYDDPALGWAWVPGYDWAPSWVSFQEGPDYIGWAPLPPTVRVVSGFNRVALAPSAYVFVPEDRFLATNLADFILPAPRAVAVFPTTRNVTVFRIVDDRVFVPGVAVARFGRRVPALRVVDFGPDLRLRSPRIVEDRIAFFRPRVRRAAFVAPPTFRRAARQSVVRFDDFPRVRRARAREVQPPWAPAWGRRGLAPGQLKQRAAVPPRAVMRDRDDDRARVFRDLRPDRDRAVKRQDLRRAERIRDVRPAQRMKKARPEVRAEDLRRTPRMKETRPERSVKRRARPERSLRRDTRPERSLRRDSRPERSVRRQARPERSSLRHARPERSMRQHARQGPRQHQARPARQHNRPAKHRPR